MFTSMGLRHIVVLGGTSGGEVRSVHSWACTAKRYAAMILSKLVFYIILRMKIGYQ